jgi:hypothetical protein
MPRKLELWKCGRDGKSLINALANFEANLTDRDLAITGGAIIDLGLVHLLENRLANLPKMTERFLGLDEGEGPASTFSARIQLAALVGLITEDDALYLAAIKNIRNRFAHRVAIDFLSSAVTKEFEKLRPYWKKIMPVDEWKKDPKAVSIVQLYVDEGVNQIGKTNKAGRKMFAYSVITYNVHLSNIDSLNERVKTLKFAPKGVTR